MIDVGGDAPDVSTLLPIKKEHEDYQHQWGPKRSIYLQQREEEKEKEKERERQHEKDREREHQHQRLNGRSHSILYADDEMMRGQKRKYDFANGMLINNYLSLPVPFPPPSPPLLSPSFSLSLPHTMLSNDTDTETSSKIRSVLEREFDAEIELRDQELRVIEDRLRQTKELLQTLEALIPTHDDAGKCCLHA